MTSKRKSTSTRRRKVLDASIQAIWRGLYDLEFLLDEVPAARSDELLALEPTCCLTLAQSLDARRAERSHPFGPALNLAQQAEARGLRHLAIRARAA